ncbi:hypothetical protein DMX12_17610 [Pseudomonas sp. MB-090624]|nr:hypothetical protein DMX12_17610 [Pseudomonas sp. MB-090624]
MKLGPEVNETVSVRVIATKDHAEVCPVSRGVMFQPLSKPLQPGVRFLCDPIPAPPTVFLTVHLPKGQRYGLTTFPLCHTTGLGPAFSPEVLMATYPHIPQGYPTSYHFGSCLTAVLAWLSLRCLSAIHLCWPYQPA